MSGLTCSNYSDFPHNISYEKISSTKCLDHCVRLKIHFSPINPADINMMEGKYLLQPELPFVCGNEGVAEVIECGRSVTQLCVGDFVICPFQNQDSWEGFWKQEMVILEDYCIPFPEFFSLEQASMLSVNPVTAYLLLTQFVSLKPGDVIIQNLANSSVGRWVIHLAKLMGVKTINTVRSSDVVGELKGIGADSVIVEKDRFSANIVQKGQCKLALNGVGGSSSREIAKCLAPYGTMVTYGAMSKEPVSLGNALLIFQNINCTGFNRSRWINETSMDDVKSVFKSLFELMPSFFEIPIYDIFPLNQYENAIGAQLRGGRKGKVLFECC
ncbi:hypothetical protein DID78_02770 [Candidatus Marinamargulisbacteria bacterium SCGC AG-343-D04]|nr:hypothetical protein DID78_02770 [Candidatus Marinamargulisbacteria bacterium SCGC AG-343-D04]